MQYTRQYRRKQAMRAEAVWRVTTALRAVASTTIGILTCAGVFASVFILLPILASFLAGM